MAAKASPTWRLNGAGEKASAHHFYTDLPQRSKLAIVVEKCLPESRQSMRHLSYYANRLSSLSCIPPNPPLLITKM